MIVLQMKVTVRSFYVHDFHSMTQRMVNSMEEMESKVIFGKRLKRFREESGYTQSIVANILGIERSTYTYYETGKTTPVVFDLMRLCRLYRVTMDDLCGYNADVSGALGLGDSGQTVKVRPRRKDRYLRDSLQDLTTDEQQLLAYYRSAALEDRAQLFEHLRTKRRRDHRRPTEK